MQTPDYLKDQEVKEANEKPTQQKRQLKDRLPRTTSSRAKSNDHERAAINETLQDVKEQAEESAPKAEATGEQDAFAFGFGALVHPGQTSGVVSSVSTTQPFPPRARLSRPLNAQLEELGTSLRYRFEKYWKTGIAASLSSVHVVGSSNDSSSSSDRLEAGSCQAEAGSTVVGCQ